MASESNLGPIGKLGNGYRQESPYVIDDAPPRVKRSAFFTIVLAQLMWWMPLLWARFLYAPYERVSGVNYFVWSLAALIALASALQAFRILGAARQGRFAALGSLLRTQAILGAAVCGVIIGGWATSSLAIDTPLGSNFYFFSAAVAFFFLLSTLGEAIHALRAGSRWGAGYDAASVWRVENGAYFWLWNCLWMFVFYAIFFWL